MKFACAARKSGSAELKITKRTRVTTSPFVPDGLSCAFQNRSVQQYRHRALQQFHAHHQAPLVLLLQDQAFHSSQRPVFDPNPLPSSQKRPGPHRIAGAHKHSDRADLFFGHRRSSLPEADNRFHPGHPQHRNPLRRVFEPRKHVTRKQRRVQNLDAVRPDTFIFIGRKETFDFSEALQALKYSKFMLWLDRQSIPPGSSVHLSRVYRRYTGAALVLRHCSFQHHSSSFLVALAILSPAAFARTN